MDMDVDDVPLVDAFRKVAAHIALPAAVPAAYAENAARTALQGVAQPLVKQEMALQKNVLSASLQTELGVVQDKKIAEKFGSMEKTLMEKLDAMEKALGGKIDVKLDAMGGELGALNKKLDAIYENDAARHINCNSIDLCALKNKKGESPACFPATRSELFALHGEPDRLDALLAFYELPLRGDETANAKCIMLASFVGAPR